MASDDWERHKAIILHLYLLENTSLHQVASYMQQNHNFAKKKSQYEYQFKKWGVKKNLKKENWQHLRHQLQRRTGKQSEVTLFGVPLSPSRVRKETRRYTTIPTAGDFGKRPPSPEALNEMIIRAQTPPIIEDITWPSLPWFHFKNKILPALRDPSGLLNTFFAALGSEASIFQCKGENAFKLLFDVLRNPLELRKAALFLTDMIPDDSVGGHQKAGTLTQKQLSLSMATETLKLVFFSLSNNNRLYDEGRLCVYDRLIPRFVEVVSRSNPEILSCIFSGHCATTHAIKEAVFGAAIRHKNYAMVSRLLESGVDPNIEIQSSAYIDCRIERGMIDLFLNLTPFVWSSIHEAALTCDLRLAKILLNAGASVNSACLKRVSVLEIAAFAGGSTGMSDKSMEFAQLLVEHGALVDQSASCRRCQRLKLILPIAISMARRNNCMAKFLIEKDVSMRLYTYSEVSRRGCWHRRWSSGELMALGIDFTPLNLAIASGNERLIGRLLQPVLLHPAQASVRVVEQALITSCLAGDADTASKLLVHHPGILKIDRWAGDVTPLVATAWNKDIIIAELLLGLGTHIGPRPGDGILQASTPTPIHVAAYHGNTSLVRHLMCRGADYNVHYTPSPRFGYFDWLLPVAVASPLQLALWSGNGGTATLLVSHHSNIRGEKLAQAAGLSNSALTSDLVFKGPNVLSANQNVRMVLETTVEIGDAISIIRSYFLLGGLYRSEDLYLAVRAAIKSKDNSIVQLLAGYRPPGEIDSHEASSLVISIEEREWDLVSLLLRDPFLPSPSGSYYRISDEGLWFYESEDSLPNKPYPCCNGDGVTPLGYAIHSAIEPAVEEMVRRGYKLQDGDMPPLVRDIVSDAHAATWALYPLESMDLSCRQELLIYSIHSCCTQRVQRCIKLVDSLDFVSRFYESPLMLAASIGDVALVRLLLDAGASTEFNGGVRDYLLWGRQTALQVAAAAGRLDAAKILLDRGAIVDQPGQMVKGATALQYSAIGGHLSIAQLLLSRGADINAPPAKWMGRTALEGAAENGRLDMVQFLLESGTNLEGRMRIHYVRSVGLARKEAHYAVANLLKEYGSWGERHQVLYDRPHTLKEDGYFQYDEGTDDWRFRKMGHGRDGWCSVASSDSSFVNSSDESDDSDDGTGEANNIEDDSDEIPDGTYDIDYIPQAWWDGLDLTVAEPNGRNFTYEPALGCDLASPQSFMGQRVIELDQTLEGGDAEGKTTERNTAIEAIEDCHTTDRQKIWEQESTVGEEVAGFEINNYAPGVDFANEQLMLPNVAETEWEGPFSGFSEIDDLNRTFGVLPFRF
ncbi:ankyrin repeat-containing domain protein [Xylaria acuta]|nr:ankyrin repeat-containing domain protein [Xylaria acuta]